MNRRFSWFNATSLTLGFAFLYLPMVILVIFHRAQQKEMEGKLT